MTRIHKSIKLFSVLGSVAGMSLMIHGGLVQTQADDVTYIGSGKCKMCHKKKYDPWSKTKHASLKAAENDPEGVKHRKATGFDPATGKFNEDGVTCEACHGPGSAHLKAPLAEKKTTIVNGAKLEPAREAMICGQCHATGKSKSGKDYPEGFKPGMDLNEIFTVEQPAQHTPLANYSEWSNSKHAAKGIGCFKCHDPHGDTDQPHQLKQPVNELCGSCHAKEKDIKTHQPNAPAAATSCNNCHMPDGVHKFTSDTAKQGMEALKGK